MSRKGYGSYSSLPHISRTAKKKGGIKGTNMAASGCEKPLYLAQKESYFNIGIKLKGSAQGIFTLYITMEQNNE